MLNLGFYRFLSRFKVLNYRAKIMVMAFIGTHIPLLALISFYVIQTSRDWQTIVSTIGVALTATLVGTGITLLVLNMLLRPVIATSKALRTYRETRKVADLPTEFTDEAGTLMADAHRTMTHLEASLSRLEYSDMQTGLPNRARFAALVQDLLADGGSDALVAVMRFENYERLAEAYDQQSADNVVIRLAARLTSAPETAAVVARIESNVFGLILRDSPKDEGEAALAGLIGHINGEVTTARFKILPDLRGGIATLEQGQEAAAVIDNAIAATGATDKAGQVKLHTPNLRESVRRRFDLEQDLRRALKQDEFILHYQPVVNATSGQVVGAEALVRWQHPELGMVSPGQFIPAAESTGLIDPIGIRVLELACAQMKTWDEAEADPIKIAVNLSARQFANPTTTDVIRATLSNCGLSGQRLEVELTETAAMADQEYTQRSFALLRDLGVSVAIDDFGTGYASMSYLRKLSFDKLKIDREFVSYVDEHRDSQAICAALVALADGMGLTILAEGTERPEEIAYLRSIGCELFQGFYFSKPVAASNFSEALADIAMLTAAMAPAEPRGAMVRKAS